MEHYLGNGIDNVQIKPLPQYDPNLDYSDPTIREALEKTVNLLPNQIFEKYQMTVLNF